MLERYMKHFGRVDQSSAYFRIIKGIFELSKGNLEVLEIVIRRRSRKSRANKQVPLGNSHFSPHKKQQPYNISWTFLATSASTSPSLQYA